MTHEFSPAGSQLRALVLLGPPGSGKGTQARILGQVPGYWAISMGDILRSLEGTREPGRTIQSYLHRGELVPAPLVIAAWRDYLQAGSPARFDPQSGCLVLDGLPRNIEQAERLETMIRVERVIHLECRQPSSLIERIRRRDEGRQDDAHDDVIGHRFDVYREQTAPLLDWYPRETVAAVDALRRPIEVLQQIVAILTAPERQEHARECEEPGDRT